MAGFDLEGYEERIPCPRCGSTDCCGIQQDKRGFSYLICSVTGKRVTVQMLEKSAKQHGLKPHTKLL
jgi:transcription elongation factor Elf1